MTATRTRIVATIGPASDDDVTIDALLDAGLHVARVNGAHGTPQGLAATIARLRQRAAARAAPLAVLADLGGPKLRIGRFAQGPVQLEPGAPFVLTTAAVPGDATRVQIDYPTLPAEVAVGDTVFLNDGLIRLVVTALRADAVETRVEAGGWLSDRKGLAVPGAHLRVPPLTAADELVLDALAGAPPDFVGLSFVRGAADLALLRAALDRRGIAAGMVAKIERAQAIPALAEILAAADAVMVARGDLGVECPVADVPVLQKRIIRAALAAGRPVITATQMLESMIDSPRPTRAEASDVANAVLDGSDAVMLSAETAAGHYPVEAVRTMQALITAAERFAAAEPATPGGSAAAPVVGLDAAAATARSACLAADAVGAAAIVCLTRHGHTPQGLARWRPRQPILACTPDAATWRRLSLLWGVEAFHLDVGAADFESATGILLAALRAAGRLPAGAPVVLAASLPFGAGGPINTVRLITAPA